MILRLDSKISHRIHSIVVKLGVLSDGKSINSWGIATLETASYTSFYTTKISYPPTTTSKLLDTRHYSRYVDFRVFASLYPYVYYFLPNFLKLKSGSSIYPKCSQGFVREKKLEKGNVHQYSVVACICKLIGQEEVMAEL
jgi:hypothetical protein